jgi:hypothetical protein
MGITSFAVGSIAPEVAQNGCKRVYRQRDGLQNTRFCKYFRISMASAQASSSLFRLLNDATSAGESSIAKNATPITMSRMRVQAPCGLPRSCGAALGSPDREFPLKELYSRPFGGGIAN